MKAALAGVLGGFQSLGADDVRERPVDRLGAVAAIQIRSVRAAEEAHLNSLGVDLIAFKFGNRAPSQADAVDKLAVALAWRVDLRPRLILKIAKWAVREWAIDLCPVCKGAGKVPAHDVEGLEGTQPMETCSPCHGTGKRRYSDQERAEALGEPYSKALAEAHGLIGRAEDLAVRGAAKMLERW